jgi:hypothetical protein
MPLKSGRQALDALRSQCYESLGEFRKTTSKIKNIASIRCLAAMVRRGHVWDTE